MLREVEECWTLVGHRRGAVWHMYASRYAVGRAHDVEFDARFALEREERYGDVVGFLHTHPTPSLAPSARDVRTMRAWCSAFGKPLVCLVAHGRLVRGYRFDGDTGDHVPLALVERFPRGRWVGVNAYGGQVPSRGNLPAGRQRRRRCTRGEPAGVAG